MPSKAKVNTERFMSHFWHKIGLGLVTLLVACGGSGGGGGSSPTSPPIAQTGPATPLKIDSTNAQSATVLGVAFADIVLTLGQNSANAVQAKFSLNNTSFQESCPNGGVVDFILIDTNGDGKPSVGETITINYRDCRVDVIDSIASGSVQILIRTPTLVGTKSLTGTTTFQTGFRLLDSTKTQSFGVSGSFLFEFATDTLSRTLAIKSSATDDLKFSFDITTTSGTTKITESLMALNLSKVLRRDTARSVNVLKYRLESGAMNGAISINTPTSISSFFDTYPEQGLIEISGASSSRLQIKPGFVVDSPNATITLDSNGDGNIDNTYTTPWTNLSSGYMWWGDIISGMPTFGVATPPKSFISNDFVVLNQSMMSGSLAVNSPIYIQLSRELAANTVAPVAFLDRQYSYTSKYLWGSARVLTDVKIDGALITITPKEQLQHDFSYSLTLADPITGAISYQYNLTDKLGNVLALYSYWNFNTPNTLSASIRATNVPVLAGASTINLTAADSFGINGPISYSWSINTTSATLDSTNAVTTNLTASAGTLPVIIGIDLTITDASGEYEKAHYELQTVADLMKATILYMRSTSGDYIGLGQTYTFTSSTGTFNSSSYSQVDYFTLNYNSNIGYEWWAVNLASAPGVALQVGLFDNATRAPFRGTGNGIDVYGAGRGCNQTAGKFEIFEIQRNSAGAIVQLAADFEQRCETTGAPLYGSVRINSSRPITP